jgi:hypothetical protein
MFTCLFIATKVADQVCFSASTILAATTANVPARLPVAGSDHCAQFLETACQCAPDAVSV